MLRASLLADVANDELGELVYERDGRVVAQFELAPVELGSTHRGLAQPDRAALLGWAATAPEARGTGAGVALTEASLAWAHERGYACMVTDWRETNLLSSRFWPARGFRRSFRAALPLDPLRVAGSAAGAAEPAVRAVLRRP